MGLFLHECRFGHERGAFVRERAAPAPGAVYVSNRAGNAALGPTRAQRQAEGGCETTWLWGLCRDERGWNKEAEPAVYFEHDASRVSTQWKSAHATKEKVAMSVTMDDSIKRWTAKRKTALVVEIIQGKTTVAEASRAYDLSPSEIEGGVDDAKRGMENALRANPLEIREQYEKQLKDLQEAYGEAMLELRARKKLAALMEREDGN